MTVADTMAGRLAQIRLRIAQACQRAATREVTLLPVSKTFGVDAIRAAMALGLNRFGENKTGNPPEGARPVGEGCNGC